jgi:hypothetical protein
MSKSQIKVLLIAFFDVRGIVHMEFLPQGTTINQHVYKEILQRLLRSIIGTKGEIFGIRTPGCCTMTTPRLTLLSVSESS